MQDPAMFVVYVMLFICIIVFVLYTCYEEKNRLKSLFRTIL